MSPAAPLWLFALILAPFVLVGGYLLWFGLLGDRSKGRPRCPRCWYSMAGSQPDPGGARRCPECGHTIRRDRDLLRNHRRWKLIMLGALLLLTAAAWPVYESLRSNWWRPYLPDTALIALTGRARDEWPERLLIERIRRDDVVVGEPVPDRLWGWQRRWLFERCVGEANDALQLSARRRTAAWIGAIIAQDAGERERLAQTEPILYSNDLTPQPCPAPDEIIAAAANGEAAVQEVLNAVAPNILGDVTGDTPRALTVDRIDLEFDGQEGRDCLLILRAWPLRQVFVLLARRGLSWGLCGFEHASRSDESGNPARIIMFGKRPFLACELAVPGSGLGFRGEVLNLYSLSTAGIQLAASFRVRAELDAEFPIRYTSTAEISRIFEQDGQPAFETTTRIDYLNSPALWEKVTAPGAEAARAVDKIFTRQWTQRYVWSPASSRFIIDRWWTKGGPERTDAPPEFGVYKSTFDNFVTINHDRLLEFARSGTPGAKEWIGLLPLAWPQAPAAKALAREAED